MQFRFSRPAPDPAMPFGLRAGFQIMRCRPLTFLAAAWASGTALGSSSGVPYMLWLPPAIAFFALTVWRRRLISLCAVFFFLAALIVGACSVQPVPMEKQSRSVSGTLCAEPRLYDEYALLTLSSVSLDGEAYPHRVRIYLYPNGAPFPSMEYGDRIETTSSLASPKGETGDGGYDPAASLWRSGIALTGSASAKNTVFTAGGPSPMRLILRLRSLLGARIDSIYTDQAPLARALLIGDRSFLSDEDYSAFQDAGIVHLLAVSGLHVSVLAEALRAFLRHVLRFSRKAAYWTILPFLVFYAALTGFPASILRAVVCFALIDAATLLSRPSDSLTGLSAAFLILCWADPLCAFDPGFQLSFSAMLGLCTLMPALSSALTPGFMLRTPLRRALWSPIGTIAASLSATIGTIPAAASLFGGLTLWALAANIVAIPLTSLAMPVLLLSLGVEKAALPATWLLRFLSGFAGRIGTLPEKLRLSLPRMAWGFIALYVLIGLLFAAQTPVRTLKRRRARRLKALAVLPIALITAASSLWMHAPVLHEDGLTITFIDVGQGDSALINAQGQCYMVDTGENHSAENRLLARSVSLEALFLTHPDLDHAGSAAKVIEAGHVKTVYLPECWPRLDVPEELSCALEECETRYLSAGDVIDLSADVHATVLHPPKGYIPETDNAASLVLLVEYGSGSALLTGDIADNDITFPIPDCDLVKLAHHGSESSSSALLLQAASPSAAILSVGLNSYNHPAWDVLNRLNNLAIPYYRTDKCGDITALIHPGGGISIDCWLDNGPTEAA